MIIKKLLTKDGIEVGRIEEVEGIRFVISTGEAKIILNGKVLEPTNRFGKVRPYMISENDKLQWYDA